MGEKKEELEYIYLLCEKDIFYLERLKQIKKKRDINRNIIKKFIEHNIEQTSDRILFPIKDIEIFMTTEDYGGQGKFFIRRKKVDNESLKHLRKILIDCKGEFLREEIKKEIKKIMNINKKKITY